MKLFAGGHFYIGSERTAVVGAIADLLAPLQAHNS
jgi:hypothetical protein